MTYKVTIKEMVTWSCAQSGDTGIDNMNVDILLTRIRTSDIQSDNKGIGDIDLCTGITIFLFGWQSWTNLALVNWLIPRVVDRDSFKTSIFPFFQSGV